MRRAVIMLLMGSVLVIGAAVWIVARSPLLVIGSVFQSYVASVHTGRARPLRARAQTIDLMKRSDRGPSEIFAPGEHISHGPHTGPFGHYTHATDVLNAMRSGQLDLANRLMEQGDLFDHAYILFDLMERSIGQMYTRSYALAHMSDRDRMLGLLFLRMAEQENCTTIDPMTSRADVCSYGNVRFSETKALHRSLDHWRAALQRGLDPTTRWLYTLTCALADVDTSSSDWTVCASIDRVDAGPRFENAAPELGLDHQTFYGGVCVDDFSGDGLLDIVSTSGDLNTPMRLMVGTQSGGYEDATASFGLDSVVGGVHVQQVDFDVDGHLDLFILRGGWLLEEARDHPNGLYRNVDGTGFQDVTAEMGLLNRTASHTAVWFDANRDGWPDLFVGNENTNSQLFINRNGNGFRDVSASAGIHLTEQVKGAQFGDFNNDGWPDLYVSCYNAPNRLYMNRPGERTVRFEEVAGTAGVAAPRKSFAVAVLDVDNDGWQDIFCPSYVMSMDSFVRGLEDPDRHGAPSPLYMNQGDGTFTPLDDRDLRRGFLPMGVDVGDVDGDGFQDIYIGTGFPTAEAMVPNVLLRNDAGRGVQDITVHSNTGHLQKGHGISFFDQEGDGDLDILVSMGGFYPVDRFDNALYRNLSDDQDGVFLKPPAGRGHWPIGTRFRWTLHTPTGEQIVHRTAGQGGSYGSSPLAPFVGQAVDVSVYHIEAIEPDGTRWLRSTLDDSSWSGPDVDVNEAL